MSSWNLTKERLAALRSEYKQRNVRGRYPRQKMLPEYKCLYPWVLPDETDPYFAFCSVCECRLSAKRSDLGKHECSIKHTENASKKIRGLDQASRKGDMMKGNHVQQQIKVESNDSPAEVTVSSGNEDDNECDEDTGEDDAGSTIDRSPYIKKEPSDAASSNVLSLQEENNCTVDSQDSQPNAYGDAADDGREGEDENEDDDGDDDDDDEEDVESYSPLPAKRSSSEADYLSQHSNKVDGMPFQVTIGDASTGQQFSIREIAPAGPYFTSSNHNSSSITSQYKPHKTTPSLTTPQTPCKITIKKITAPIITPPLHSSLQGTTAAQIMPVPAAKLMPVPAALSISRQPATQLTTSTAGEPINCQDAVVTVAPSTAALQSATSTVRDSFDLFFDSICASVKSLPPKLATEGKIRVMQLIGELEIRAITERERSQAVATVQQNSTVASTTK